MDRQYVESSMIASIGFDSNTSTLKLNLKRTVLFGSIMTFPKAHIMNLWKWFSGKFFLTHIKGQYTENQVG